MLFKDFSTYLDKIASISSRNEIVSMLADLFTKLSADEIGKSIYLLSGRVAPLFDASEFSVGDNLVLKSIALAKEQPVDDIKLLFNKEGDLGDVFYILTSDGMDNLSIISVFDTLKQITQLKGKGSVEGKITLIASTLRRMDSLSGRYFIKIILGDFRLGFSTRTILDALSWSIDKTKKHRANIEKAYTYVSDLGLIASTLKKEGLIGLEHIDVHIGIPIFPKLVSPVKNASEIIQRMGTSFVQPKYDGIRVQIHVMPGTPREREIKVYSRNLTDMTEMFPDIVANFRQLTIDCGIFDGEAIGYNENLGRFLPFQQTIQRKRKYEVSTFSSEYPLTVFLFDLLFINGQDMMGLSLQDRFASLSEMLQKQPDEVKESIRLTETKVIDNADTLYSYFASQIENHAEGIVAKDPTTAYLPGTRNYDWVKLKRSNMEGVNDTFDTVVLGYYYGQGSRAKNGIGGLLVGVYNKQSDTYETLAKVGSGVKEGEWSAIREQLDAIKVESIPTNVRIQANLMPNVLVRPAIVCIVKADEITKSPIHTAGKTPENQNGFALRFPRLITFNRLDKGPEDTTSVEEIQKMYKNE